MADVKVPVRLWRKTCHNRVISAFLQIFIDFLLDKVPGNDFSFCLTRPLFFRSFFDRHCVSSSSIPVSFIRRDVHRFGRYLKSFTEITSYHNFFIFQSITLPRGCLHLPFIQTVILHDIFLRKDLRLRARRGLASQGPGLVPQ